MQLLYSPNHQRRISWWIVPTDFEPAEWFTRHSLPVRAGVFRHQNPLIGNFRWKSFVSSGLSGLAACQQHSSMGTCIFFVELNRWPAKFLQIFLVYMRRFLSKKLLKFNMRYLFVTLCETFQLRSSFVLDHVTFVNGPKQRCFEWLECGSTCVLHRHLHNWFCLGTTLSAVIDHTSRFLLLSFFLVQSQLQLPCRQTHCNG